VTIPKKQHKFIVGPKGSHLAIILQKTGCSVELPAWDDPSEVVTVRGAEAGLVSGLQMVLEKVRYYYPSLFFPLSLRFLYFATFFLPF